MNLNEENFSVPIKSIISKFENIQLNKVLEKQNKSKFKG